jgi:hypothetical protein
MRNRGSPAHRARSAPRPPPAGRSCPPARSDPERPQPPVGLRDEHSTSRSRSIRPSLDSDVQILEAVLQRHAVVSPRHAVNPWGRARTDRRYASRSRSTVTWRRSAVNRACLSFRAAWRTRSRSLDTPSPALRPGHVSLAVFPSRPIPFPPPPPPQASPACSTTSQVLQDRLTSRDRSLRAYRHSVPLTTHPAAAPPREPSRTRHQQRPAGDHGTSRFSRIEISVRAQAL